MPAPKLPDEISFTQLDREVWSELTTLPRSLAETIARHLVMAGEILDDDPETAYEHAVYARRKASRIGAVREVSGLAAYRLGKWQEALSDLRAARRITGRNAFLPVIADCERGLGRAERALEVTRSGGVETLDIAERIELRIVASGARRDLGQLEAALVELHVPELKERRARPWVARLFYAYADVLLQLGREEAAREYFARASAVDREGVTDADVRLAEVEGLDIVDTDDEVIWTDAEDPEPEPEEDRDPTEPEASDQGSSDGSETGPSQAAEKGSEAIGRPDSDKAVEPGPDEARDSDDTQAATATATASAHEPTTGDPEADRNPTPNSEDDSTEADRSATAGPAT